MTKTDVPGLRVPVIEFAPARVLHTTPPKTGSTSLLLSYLLMAGLAVPEGAVRAVLRQAQADGSAAAAGLRLHFVAPAQLPAFYAAHAGWHLLCNVRSPYERALSNWFSKLNRYAKRFDRPSYRYGKLRQVLGGPMAWPHIERANVHMQKRISFAAMLAGLARNGVGFDSHFEQQSVLLALDKVTYDRMIRLETMGSDLPQAFEALGVPQAMTGRLAAIPHRNRTAARPSALLDAEAVALIGRIYPDDCRLLGYDSPLDRQTAQPG
ncbi:sulfotransferase family 2 domain-containing protein [Paragemmobacter straminiformis]|uniref:Sulfotransferase family 2 domain-containing protein n=1 Tax=Paragemmobacter straminiformis TaxID=2045119 RepID=A0A842I4P9_9RHOB|nr:sulfotransferase family 2 domain-containing protein [Gemmobacter straminiformis]MBC2834810.1 sulfotransferase family 2 domain-containing protein [Gemmobacter straminiformis]